MKQIAKIFLLAWVSAAYAADSDLDSNFQPNSTAEIYDIARQPDGRLVVGGFGGGLVRLNNDGSRDNSFTGSVNNTIRAIAIMPSGKILVGGTFASANGVTRNRLARFNSDGTLDTSFVPPALSGYVYCIAPLSNGQVLIAGGFGAPIRLNDNGSKDTTFSATTYGDTLSMFVQPDGKILVGGALFSSGTPSSNYFYRLNSNGSRDNSFATTLNNFVADIAVQADGKLVVGGEFTSVNGVARARVARLDSTGALDTSFDPGIGSNIANGWVWSISIQSDNKIVLGGLFADYGGTAQDYLVRLNSNGSLDNGFTPAVNNWVRSTLIQPDGKLLVGGELTAINGTSLPHLARLQTGDADNDGIVDALDNCPAISNATQTNTDGASDGGDACDSDDDNDSVLDVDDAFPLDASETLDTDNDGTGNNADTDDDNDGYADAEDAYPLNPHKWKFPSCDFDGDSDSDILVRDLVTKLWKIFKVQAAVVTSNVTIGIPQDVYTQHMAALDSDGDGDKDILTRNSNTGLWTLYEIDNGNTIAAHPLAIYAHADWKIVATGDFNGDAVDDVLLRDSVGGSYRSFLLGHHGVAQVKHFNGWLSSQSVDQGVGDFDGDGTDDLLVRRTSDNLYFIFKVANGDVVSRNCVCNLWKNPDWTFQFASDMNADGTSDIVIRGTGPSADGKWWRFQMDNRAATNTAYFNLYYNKDRVSLGAVGDYNGDGTNDVMVRVDDATTYVAPVVNGLITGHNRIGQFGADQAIEQ